MNAGYSVRFTRLAERDYKRCFPGRAERRAANAALEKLERDPEAGKPMTADLWPARSLRFSTGSATYRALYTVDHSERACIVFLIAPRATVYRDALRRFRRPPDPKVE